MATTMKAWAQTKYGGPEVLEIMELPKPVPRARDLLVKVLGAAVNPVDCKKRTNYYGNPNEELKGPPMILGFDAAGVVESTGIECVLFRPGDEVWFAGVINRPGCNAEYTCVDERIVARKPKNLSFRDASAVPLCALTAWEGMVEGMGIAVPQKGMTNPNAGKSILVVAGAGGVGSIASQIAKKILLIGTVISTASRPDTIEYCKKMGADATIDHTKDYAEELKAIGLNGVDYVMNCIDAHLNLDQLAKVINPLGKVCFISGVNKPLNWGAFMSKRVTIVFELMFTRGLFGHEMEKQHEILENFGKWCDEGVIDPRAETKLEWSKLPDGHRVQDSGKAIGKTVYEVKF